MEKKEESGSKIVISGMSGTYPQARNTRDFEYILYNKINPITKASSRWVRTNPESVEYLGQVPNLDRFDNQFFRINHIQSHVLDPCERKTLEHSYQALYDAGVSPEQLRGKSVGVYMAVVMTETRSEVDHLDKTGQASFGNLKAMIANRVSYWLDIKGPSYTMNQLCGGSLIALQKAYQAMQNGVIEAAIVGGNSVSLVPQSLILYGRAIPLSKDGKTKSFSADASGCVKSDAMSVLFLQKAEDAFRVYAELCYVKGEFITKSGILTGFNRNPKEMADFLKQFYNEAAIHPNDVEFVEAFGCATPEADEVELEVIDEIFNGTRTQPLPVGSVMSNVGYTDAAAGITSIAKVLLGYHRGEMAGNLHYDSPRRDVEALRKGRIVILKDRMQFRPAYTAINGISFCGVNTHALLKNYYKEKDINRYKSAIPYLITISGRRETAVSKIIGDLKSRPIDPEEIALHHSANESKVNGHLGRGFVVLDKDKEGNTATICNDAVFYDDTRRQLWFVYSGMGSQWSGMGAQLMRIPIFAAAIERCRIVLEPRGVDIINIITSPDKSIFDNILNSFVGISAIQIGLTDVLLAMGLVPDKIVGHSLGELGCSYADGSLTAEQIILAAYTRGVVSLEVPFIRGAMFAVGMGYQTISKILPPEIEVACHNSSTSSTISGPDGIVREFAAKLIENNIFVKEVNVSNIAYHSSYIADAGPSFLKYMKEIVTDPKLRSDRWLSTSVPRAKWQEPDSAYSSAEYHTNNILNPVLFEEILNLVPDGAVLVEIAPHGLMQAILKRALPAGCKNIAMSVNTKNDNVTCVLEAIGKLYLEGFQPKVRALYPKIEFPVSTGTPYMSHLIEWNHDEKLSVGSRKLDDYRKSASCNFKISIHEDANAYLRGNKIQGILVYPYAAMLIHVWDTLAMTFGKPKKGISIQFHDIHFHCQPQIEEQKLLKLNVSLMKGTGMFQITHEDTVLVNGYIIGNSVAPKAKTIFSVIRKGENDDDEMFIPSRDIYDAFEKREYAYNGDFRSIYCSNASFTEANLHWKENWVTLIDGMLQLNNLNHARSSVAQPLYIREISINVKEHSQACSLGGKKDVLKVTLNERDNFTRCGGIVINDIKYRNELKMAIMKEKSMLKKNCTADRISIDDFEISRYVLQSARIGDFNSLHWLKVPLNNEAERIKIKVHYAAVGVHDMKKAAGINPNGSSDQRYGMDFSGLTDRGERVMGLVECGAISTILSVNPKYLWPIPEDWSLEDAVTVPQAYVQAFYYLVIKSNISYGKTILVHGGAGALGQAIIRIALAYNCKVFTTVSDWNKKHFLLKLFPQLNEQDIANSRNESFEDMIKNFTNGIGCDIVVNTVGNDLKNASIKCCISRHWGVILEPIQHMSEENFQFNVDNLAKKCRYSVTDFTEIFRNQNEFEQVKQLLADGIACGFVQPLSRVTYPTHELVRAFELLAASQHRGRVLLRLRNTHPHYVIKHEIPDTKDNDNSKHTPRQLATLFSFIDSDEILASTDVVPLPTLVSNANPQNPEINLQDTYLCIVPGLEGHYKRFETLCECLKLSAVVLQPGLDHLYETPYELALRYSKIILNKLGVKQTFYLLGYEFGVPVVLELAKILENQGLTGIVYCLGGTPKDIQRVIEDKLQEFESDKELETGLANHMIKVIGDCANVDEKVLSGLSWGQLETCLKELRSHVALTTQYMRVVIQSAIARIFSARQFIAAPVTLRSQLVFMRAELTNSTARMPSYSKRLKVYDLNIPLADAPSDLRCPAIINRFLPAEVTEAFEHKNLCQSYLFNAQPRDVVII